LMSQVSSLLQNWNEAYFWKEKISFLIFPF
jgi:hypothetical protein